MEYSFPKIDLHVHLDGSLPLKLAYALAQDRQLITPDCTLEQFRERIVVGRDNGSLNEFLARFELPIAILQDEEALVLCTRELIKTLALQGLAYVELRFAPQFHTQKGLTQHQAVKAVIKGMRIAMCEHPQIKAGLILCMMTLGEPSLNHEANLETIRTARDFKGKGVVAVDLAGAEGITPMEGYRDCFELAKEYGIPFTIHAGESGPAASVKAALDLGASRIGHGGHCLEDSTVMQEVIDKKIPLEMCLTSNVQCRNQLSYSDHALKPLMEHGAVVTLNTDNMTISDTTLDQEYDKAVRYLGLTREDLIHLNLNSVRAAFADKELKQQLTRQLMECL